MYKGTPDITQLLQDLIFIKQLRSYVLNIVPHCQDDAPRHKICILIHQYETIYHKDVSIKTVCLQVKYPYFKEDE